MSWGRLLLAGVALGIAAGYLFRTTLLERAGWYLVEEEAPVSADAIVVLSGSFPDRILEAVALYQDGFAPRIILCRAPPNSAVRRLRALGVRVPWGGERNRAVAEQLGVPPEAITIVDRAGGSTFTEALEILRYVHERGYQSFLLVTSKYHSRRAARIYRYLGGDSLRIISRPARDDGFRPDRWWHDRLSIRRVIIEYQKLLVFLLYDRWLVAPVQSAPAGVKQARVLQ